MDKKKTVVFDFDGVIHSYISGWKGKTEIPDPPVPGIEKTLKQFHDAGYEVVIVSTRCKNDRQYKGYLAIMMWLEKYNLVNYIDGVVAEKPPAVCYIDDRAICFDGHPETLFEQVEHFKPWYRLKGETE